MIEFLSFIYLLNYITDGYGVYLTEIVVDQTLDLPLRQLASVMLKQYVESSWTEGDDPEPIKIVASEQAKKVIKSILPEGLYDANSKVSSSARIRAEKFYKLGLLVFRFAVLLLTQFHRLPAMIGLTIGLNSLKSLSSVLVVMKIRYTVQCGS